MIRTLNGGPAGGEQVEVEGTTYSHDCGTRLAQYEVRTYVIDGESVEIAVFVGYAPKG